jgi:hypothetical protein
MIVLLISFLFFIVKISIVLFLLIGLGAGAPKEYERGLSRKSAMSPSWKEIRKPVLGSVGKMARGKV